jgi:hypothetical protein
MSELICTICGNTDQLCWNEGVCATLTKHQMCFSCNFWREYVERDASELAGRSAVIDGVHYVVCEEPSAERRRNPTLLGFGGVKTVIRFKDGREVTSHNLWCQGRIPPLWRDKFPDNAEFVRQP